MSKYHLGRQAECLTIDHIHRRGELLLEKIYRSRLIPMWGLIEIASIINAAFWLGKSKRDKGQGKKDEKPSERIWEIFEDKMRLLSGSNPLANREIKVRPFELFVLVVTLLAYLDDEWERENNWMEWVSKRMEYAMENKEQRLKRLKRELQENAL